VFADASSWGTVALGSPAVERVHGDVQEGRHVVDCPQRLELMDRHGGSPLFSYAASRVAEVSGGLVEARSAVVVFVVGEALAGPFPGHQYASSGDAEGGALVCFSLAATGCHGVAGTAGLDAVEQPHRTAW
jgi:hypothetical protein